MCEQEVKYGNVKLCFLCLRPEIVRRKPGKIEKARQECGMRSHECQRLQSQRNVGIP